MTGRTVEPGGAILAFSIGAIIMIGTFAAFVLGEVDLYVPLAGAAIAGRLYTIALVRLFAISKPAEK